MDADAVDRARADLEAWGLLEPGPQATRRLRAALARASAHLAREEAEGRRAPGNPLANVAALALEELVPGAWAPAHRDVVAAVQLAGLPDGVRDLLAPP